MICWFSRAMRSYSALRTDMLSEEEAVFGASTYCGGLFMMLYILPKQNLILALDAGVALGLDLHPLRVELHVRHRARVRRRHVDARLHRLELLEVDAVHPVQVLDRGCLVGDAHVRDGRWHAERGGRWPRLG